METETPGRPDTSVLAICFSGLGHLRRAWPRFMAADLATRMAAMLVLAPIVAFVARRALNRVGGGAITDQDIVWFALTPLGIATLLFVAAGSSLAGLLGHTAIMTVAAGMDGDRAVSRLAGLRHAISRLPAVFELSVRGLIRLLIDAAPWLFVAAAVYLGLLTDHDINFYLAERPPKFWIAGALVGVALSGLTWFVGRRLLSWSIALPRLLFGGASPAGALRASAEATQGRRLRALALFVAWGAATMILTALITGASGWLGNLLVPESSASLARTAAGLGIATVVGGIANLSLSVLSVIILALFLFELDRAWAEPWVLPEAVREKIGARTELSVPGWTWGVVAISASGIAVFAGFRLVEGITVEDDVQITAHRGASARAPENTLAAMRAAIEDQADWVELDVQETSDGVVVVHHDKDFMRVAGDVRKIWETPWESVSQIPNGAWFGPGFEAERVVSLEQLLEVTRDRVRVNIELKTYGHGQQLEERVIEIVERLGLVDQVVLMSLDRPTVEKLNGLRPDWTVGLLAALSIGDLSRLDADFLAISAKNATLGFVKRAHKSGKEVLVWTVNHPAQMSAMMSLGVDGIITDEPALARDVMRQRAALTPVERLLVSTGAWFGVVEGANESSGEDDA